MRHLRVVGGLLGVVALALVATACGRAIPSSSGSENAGVKLAQTGLGRVLADADGHTLYLFEGDEAGESYCTGACASVWPPYETEGTPRAVGGLPASALGTIKRDDGETQVAYRGHPLYFYAGDASTPGRTKGQASEQFGAEWYAVRSDGKPVEETGGSSGGNGGSNDNGGGGY